MTQSAGKLFDRYYYAHNCGDPYERTDSWLAFFDRIAERIISDLHPKTVLDAGCALGFLVERLRARGVEAWGIDISEFAISHVDPSVRAYCSLGSIADPLPMQYDLIVSIEVLEHMPAVDSDRAIENLAQHSENMLISTSPYDYKEVTHFNVQQPDYWTRRFARLGFFKDVDYDATYITPWAGLYTRKADSMPSVVQAYERKLWQAVNENRELREAQIERMNLVEALQQQVQEQQAQIGALQEQCQQLVAQGSRADEVRQLQERLSESEARWNDLQKGTGWKLLQKVQSVRVRVAPPGSWMERLMYRVLRHKNE